MLEPQKPQTCHLLAIEDRQGKRIVPLEAATYSLGRDSTNSVVLYSNLISRQHALLLRVTASESTAYSFRIIDGNLQGKRSTNGLRINGQRCFSHNLKHGDLIVFGGDVRVRYYAVCNLSEAELLKSCPIDEPLPSLVNPFETLLGADPEPENFTEAGLVRLASFPELIPIPILEIDLAGTITYLNPVAVMQFPTIQAVGLLHPILVGLLSTVQNGREKFFVREVTVGAKVFEQSVHYIAESDLIRSYIVNITERKKAEAALRQAEEKYRSIFENAVAGIFQTTLNGSYSTANPMLASIYGYKSPEDLMSHVTEIGQQLYVDPNRRAEFMGLVQVQGAVWNFESQVYCKDRRVIWIAENARATYDASGQLVGYEGTVVDITVAKCLEAERQRSEAELRQRDSLLQGVAAATNYLLTDTDYATAIARALTTLGEATGVDRVFICENHPHPLTREIATSIRFEWTQQTVEPKLRAVDWQNQPYSVSMGRWYSTLAMGKSVSGVAEEFPEPERQILKHANVLAVLMVPILLQEQFWGYIGFDDCQTARQWSNSETSILFTMAASISGALQRQQAEEKIRYHALHDRLTGLPNRTLFGDRLVVSLLNAQRSGEMLAVMFLDLDRFKTINDTLGHTVGDLLLQRVTERLTSCLREGDTIARWGGDEFTLLLPQISSPEDAAKSAQRIVEALKPPFRLEEHELYITSSIGIALYPLGGEDDQTLLRNADVALYRAKELGRNNYQFYTTGLNAKASELLTLESRLYQALERSELLVYYQPQVNINTWEVIGMEALVRWQHPEVGIISPNTFIPLAEENGLIIPIGEWVLQTACAQNKAWQDQGLPPLNVAVNLSSRQFQQPHLAQTVQRILTETGLEPRFLELEITESIAMQNIELTHTILRDLQQLGVRVALDDFGTGYSSLSYLKKFPFDMIKIDQSFVQDLTADPKDMAIITAAIALGRKLDLSVVAEGVETEAQLNLLRSLHCEEVQGYFFSKPLSCEHATQLLQAKQLKG